LVYLANRFAYRVFEFLKHWYVNGFLVLNHRTVNFLEYLDRRLALKITFRNWFKPLYQDYTILGYTLGFLFRTLRIIASGIIYFFVIAIAAAIYIAWAALPIYIIYRGFFR